MILESNYAFKRSRQTTTRRLERSYAQVMRCHMRLKLKSNRHEAFES